MATTVTLYDLADARDILDTWLAETEGELTPELEQLLNELEGRTDEKIERVALFIKEQQATAKAINEEVERLQARAGSRLKAANNLKLYLQSQMERLGKTKVEGLLATVALQKNPPSVRPIRDAKDIDDIAVDVGFVRVIPETREWDKKAMLAAWKANPNALGGLAVVEQTVSLRIR